MLQSGFSTAGRSRDEEHSGKKGDGDGGGSPLVRKALPEALKVEAGTSSRDGEWMGALGARPRLGHVRLCEAELP